MYGSEPFGYDFAAALTAPAPSIDRSGAYWFESWLLDHPEPSESQLETHRAKFGPDCVEIPKETRSASELQAAGLSVKEIAHTLGLKESTVKTRLRVGA